MDELRDAANAASITLPRSWRMRQWIRRNRWPLGVFFGTLFIFLIASINLIINLHITGDEPAYLLQGYAIIHLHTVEMNRVVSAPQIYRNSSTTLRLTACTTFVAMVSRWKPTCPAMPQSSGCSMRLAGDSSLSLYSPLLPR